MCMGNVSCPNQFVKKKNQMETQSMYGSRIQGNSSANDHTLLAGTNPVKVSHQQDELHWLLSFWLFLKEKFYIHISNGSHNISIFVSFLFNETWNNWGTNWNENFPTHTFSRVPTSKLIPSPHHKRNKTLGRLKTDAHGSKMWPPRYGQLGQLRRDWNEVSLSRTLSQHRILCQILSPSPKRSKT